MPSRSCTGLVQQTPSGTQIAQASASPPVYKEETLLLDTSEEPMSSDAPSSESCGGQERLASPEGTQLGIYKDLVGCIPSPSPEEGSQSSISKDPVECRPPPSPEEDCSSSRERLKRHRIEMGGRVWIPEEWGQEKLLKDWADCSAFDGSLVPNEVMSAREALVEEGGSANSGRFQIQNPC